MNVWMWIITCLVCTGLAVQTLDVRLKLHVAFACAQWSALALISLRLAAYTLAQTTA